MSQDRKLIGWAAYFFYLSLNVLNLLYLIRFQLLALFLVISLRVVIFNWGIGSSFVAGMFDLPTFWNVFWFSFFSYMLTWTAITLLKLTLRYTDMRFQVGKRIDLSFTKWRLYNRLLFFTGCLAPIVLFTGIWLVDGGMYQIAGAIAGAVVAFALLFLVDLAQLALRDSSKGKDMAEEDLLIPFTNRFYKGAADYEPKAKVLNMGFIGWLERKLAKLPPNYGEGYISRKGNQVKILPGHIFSTVFFMVFLLLYIGGFIFWYYGYTPGHSAFNNLNLGVTSISYVMILLTLLCSLLSGFAFFFDRYRIPTLLIVALILYCANLQHKYDVRDVAENKILSPAELLEKKQNHPYIILIATNGGGIQAAAWTTQVLSGLIKECKRIDASDAGCEKAITLISSVSGGSVGTMFFVNGYDHDGKLTTERMDQIVELSKASSLDYVAGGLVYADFVRNLRIFNIIDFQDRGLALERSWRDNTKEIFKSDPDAVKGLEGYFSDWREQAREGKRPAVIFNSTTVETGSRAIFSTTDIERPDDGSSQSLPCDHGHKILFRGWDSFYRVFPKKDIKVTAAARLSASFPFVSPTANMKGGNPETLEGRHFVDGGYHENYGVASLLDWLDEGLCLGPAKPPKILIIQIVADHVFAEKEAENLGSGWFEQTLTPAGTMLSVRGTVQLARNESELKLFLRYWRDKKGIEIEKVVFEYVPKDDEYLRDSKQGEGIKEKGESELAPLSWHLTPGQKANIQKVWKRACNEGDGNKEALEAFRSFINPNVQTAPICE